MKKIGIIIRREYLSRVKKPSFIIMTIIGPLLIAGIMIVPIWLTLKDVDLQIVQVVDETHAFYGELENSSNMMFEYSEDQIADVKKNFYNTKYTSILYIPYNAYSVPSTIRLFFKKQPSFKTLKKINSAISDRIETDRIKLKFNLDKKDLEGIKPKIDIVTVNLDENGNEKESEFGLEAAVGFFCAISIYFFIFMYTVQVMRGVLEEKTNRIVEIIISSVKPFQLMAGKIIGIAFVGLTQFLLIMVLSGILVFGFQLYLTTQLGDTGTMFNTEQLEQISGSGEEINAENLFTELSGKLEQMNFAVLILTYLVYFIGGYLLYAALFAAIGSAVDSESDTQQFMLPLTAPLILAIALTQNFVSNPDGALSVWMSMIPFTSPIVMMVRIPFGVPYSEVLISIALLIGAFIFTTWISGKIYRTGILMYGKKVSYKELWKWLFYKS